MLETPRRALKLLQGGEYLLRSLPDRETKTGGGEGVHGLEGAGQGQVDAPGPTGVFQGQHLAARPRRPPGKLKVPSRLAEGDEVGPSQGRGGGEGRKGGRVRIQDRRSAPGQQSVEQAQFGGLITGHVAMVVQVILGQVQEGRRGEAHAVQPPLVDAMGRGLQRQVRHPPVRKVGEQSGDIAGIRRRQAGRRQGAVLPARTGDKEPQSAHAGGQSARRRRDLPAETGDGGLAVGPGDGHNHLRLPAVKGGSGQGVGPTGIRADDDRDPKAR